VEEIIRITQGSVGPQIELVAGGYHLFPYDRKYVEDLARLMKNSWLHLIARPIAVVVGILNAALHLVSSIWYHRRMPGFYSSPFLLIAAVYLLRTS
jgi:hypothetical protein